MKSVLIVCDNYQLIKQFKMVANSVGSETAVFSYRYSAINKSIESFRSLDLTAIDLKCTDDIDFIVGEYDLIISAHCKQIFPASLVNRVRCINIHPGLNPYNRGWFPQVFSIINKKPIGCTVHLMDEEIDHGAVIYQQEVTINSWDTSLDVYNRVLELERLFIADHLIDMVNETYTLKELDQEGNYNSIKDFDALLELDLTSKATLVEHIDLLRSLTHGDFNNGYFIDRSGKKVYVKIQLDVEK